MHRLPALVRAAAVALSGPLAIAQSATVRDHAPPCQPPSGQTCSIVVTPPVLGATTTVTTRGPRFGGALLLLAPTANYQGHDLTPFGSPGCRLYASPSTALILPQSLFSGSATVTFPIPGAVPIGAQLFVQALLTNGGPASYSMLTSNMVVATVGHEPDLTAAEIARIAPLVRIHPNEVWFPMDPLQFIQLSRFRHHRSLASDQGYNRRTGTWDTNDSHARDYYDPPVAVVNAYALNRDGTNRRPRDSNSGSSWNVFLQTFGAAAGYPLPNGSVPVFWHYRRNGSVHEVQYWWFFGFNDSAATFNHQGDWEHATVHYGNGRILGVYFSAHNGGEYRSATNMTFAGGRPVVYVARGSHAAYATTGSFNFGFDQTADGGYQWDVSRNLARLADQPWKDFAGAWGEVGAFATTTGPLGPWYKRTAP